MDDDDQCVKDTLNGNWSFPSQAFSKVSPSAKDLVRKMLVIDQKKRIKDDQVIAHPWIKVNYIKFNTIIIIIINKNSLIIIYLSLISYFIYFY